MKKLENLKNVKTLNKKNQKLIYGSKIDPCEFIQCLGGAPCRNGRCIYGLQINLKTSFL